MYRDYSVAPLVVRRRQKAVMDVLRCYAGSVIGDHCSVGAYSQGWSRSLRFSG